MQVLMQVVTFANCASEVPNTLLQIIIIFFEI